MPTILVKCADRQPKITAFYFRQTYIAQFGSALLATVTIWAISVSSLPITPSILLIILLLSRYKQYLQLTLRDVAHRFVALKHIDQQWREWGILLTLQNGQRVRLFRHQMNDAQYKQLNALLDSGTAGVSCLIEYKNRLSIR